MKVTKPFTGKALESTQQEIQVTFYTWIKPTDTDVEQFHQAYPVDAYGCIRKLTPTDPESTAVLYARFGFKWDGSRGPWGTWYDDLWKEVELIKKTPSEAAWQANDYYGWLSTDFAIFGLLTNMFPTKKGHAASMGYAAKPKNFAEYVTIDNWVKTNLGVTQGPSGGGE